MRRSAMRLDGKVGIVTGGGTGIGKAIAVAFAKEGAKVVIIGRRMDKLQEALSEVKKEGGEALAATGDVSRIGDVNRMVEETVKAFGRLDILVNSAGILISADVAGHTEKIWDNTIDINLKGTFLCIQRAVPEMLKQEKGKIINIASIAGHIGFPNAAAYCASKGGIMGMTKALAMELAPKRINVNAIGPGDIRTPLNEHLLKDPVYLKGRIDQTPYGRVGEVTDIAPAAVYLSSDDSDFVNGITLFVDGGLIIN
jgi:NAD(P)-dependent dehydrogenase (short-subunit alcohol dehydrogenase family)